MSQQYADGNLCGSFNGRYANPCGHTARVCHRYISLDVYHMLLSIHSGVVNLRFIVIDLPKSIRSKNTTMLAHTCC